MADIAILQRPGGGGGGEGEGGVGVGVGGWLGFGGGGGVRGGGVGGGVCTPWKSSQSLGIKHFNKIGGGESRNRKMIGRSVGKGRWGAIA